MPPRPYPRTTLAVLASFSALGFVGCTAPTPNATSSPTSTQAVPAAIDSVEITFVADGDKRTVSASVGDGLRACDDARTRVTADSPSPNAGVMVPQLRDREEATSVSAWAIDGYAVQFLGEGEVTVTGDAFRGTEIHGTANALPVGSDPALKIGDLDLRKAPPVDATLTFAVACGPTR
ncbi:hypothetical protein [Microbacterium testaceum]|uniref:hypothetical protein n=1 Tax=Microbacterium testaceum TaxID=2033 RepID=UPI002434C73E|nr:hypothetical protein [Microbacterium testaceum]